jgi:transposase
MSKTYIGIDVGCKGFISVQHENGSVVCKLHGRRIC